MLMAAEHGKGLHAQSLAESCQPCLAAPEQALAGKLMLQLLGG